MGVRKRRERFTVCVSKTLLHNSFVVIIRLPPHFIMYFTLFHIKRALYTYAIMHVLCVYML